MAWMQAGAGLPEFPETIEVAVDTKFSAGLDGGVTIYAMNPNGIGARAALTMSRDEAMAVHAEIGEYLRDKEEAA